MESLIKQQNNYKRGSSQIPTRKSLQIEQKQTHSPKESKQNLSNLPSHICYINPQSKLLFTAPHSTRLYRGGEGSIRKDTTIHAHEKYTSTLALRWAYQSDSSFCVWNKENKLNRSIVDPNYISRAQMPESPFHQCLHKFLQVQKDKPILHIDVHGKMDRKNDFDLDVGIECMQVKWTNLEKDFVQGFSLSLEKNLGQALKYATNMKNISARVEIQPYLHGYWGDIDIYTMTEQAIDLGIPSLQLEIPFTMRKQLFNNRQFSDAFLQALQQTYEEVVTIWWPVRVMKQKCDDKIADKLVQIQPTILQNIKNLVIDYEQWIATTNAKFI